MEFIKAEEFLNQPVEVQKVLLEWWKPKFGDLYSFINVLGDRTNDSIFKKGRAEWVENYKGLDYIPLLSEGQLRQFIEDKTNSKIDVTYYYPKAIEFDLFHQENIKGHYTTGTTDLLQAYWQVAIEIAKE